MTADDEDSRESEVQEIYVKISKRQEVFVKEDHAFLGRPRPSSTADANLEQQHDVEIEEDDK